MNADNWKAAVLACHMAGRLLAQHDFAKLVAAGERADSFGPLFDPTLWQDKHKALDEDMAVLRAADAFVAALRRAGATLGGG